MHFAFSLSRSLRYISSPFYKKKRKHNYPYICIYPHIYTHMSIHTGREGGGAGDCASHAPRKPLSLRAHAHPASTHHAVPPPLVSKLPQPPRLLSSGFLFWSAQSPTTTSARKETRETLAVQAADRARHPAPPRLFASRLPVHPATRPIAKLKKKNRD